MDTKKSKKRGNRKHDPADAAIWVQLVDQKRKAGLSIVKACTEVSREVGERVHPSLYNWYKAKLSGRPYVKKQKPSSLELKLKGPFEIPVRPEVQPNGQYIPLTVHNDVQSPPKPSDSGNGHTTKRVRVTVREYVLEGSEDDVFSAIAKLKQDPI